VTPRRPDWWWDAGWNIVGGCRPVSPGCLNCYAAQYAVTHTHPTAENGGRHHGVAVKKKDGRSTRYVFTGKKATVLPRWHAGWTWPLTWPGAKYCCLDPDNPDPGKPSLIWFGDMTDVFWAKHDIRVISRAIATIVWSPHICLLMTKHTKRAQQFFSSLDARTVRRWQPKVWIGFSAEDRRCFKQRWEDMQPLTTAGWKVFCNLAPMLEPITLPTDLLSLGREMWVIVSGEQPAPAPAACRPLEKDWARAVRDQCAASDVWFFMKQMHAKKRVPPDLHIREFPTSWVG
jgi:protein gp37